MTKGQNHIFRPFFTQAMSMSSLLVFFLHLFFMNRCTWLFFSLNNFYGIQRVVHLKTKVFFLCLLLCPVVLSAGVQKSPALLAKIDGKFRFFIFQPILQLYNNGVIFCRSILMILVRQDRSVYAVNISPVMISFTGKEKLYWFKMLYPSIQIDPVPIFCERFL
jgi:hypothetical protein